MSADTANGPRGKEGPLDVELQALKDVEGVIGSFVLGETGGILGRDLPRLFDAETLSHVGMRVRRLLDSLDQSEQGAHLTLRYPEHKVHLHRAGATVVGVISGPTASSPALTMAVTLVGRRVNKALLAGGLEGAATPERALPPTQPAIPAARLPAPPSPAREAARRETLHSSPTQYSIRGAQAPEGQNSPSAPAGRPRYFRGRRID